MGHAIQALLVRGTCRPDAARRWDVDPVVLDQGLSLVHLTHYFTAYWQATLQLAGRLAVPEDFPVIFPRETVLHRVAAELTGGDRSPYGVIMTDYFGGAGAQWAVLVSPAQADPLVAGTVNDVLRSLGVVAVAGKDEFDSLGLSRHRRTPDYLDRYEDLCEEIGA